LNYPALKDRVSGALMQRLLTYLSVLIFTASMALWLPGCGKSSQHLTIGIDPNWYPQNFENKQVYINGFVDELLLEISRHGNIEFQRVGASWDTLFDNLNKHRYEAVFSSLPSYPFNQAKYDFSINFLDIGPVFVTPAASTLTDLKQMANRVVGVLSGNQEWFLMQKYSNVIMRTYDSVSAIFEALNNNEVEGIVIDRLTAVGFIRGTYAGKLKINGSPLTNEGLHLVVLKGDPALAVKMFDENIRYLTKKKKLQKLLQKWQLD
jgi:ABC-type amino acid transport substrate-binding protein